jgi:hypothetical protein
MESLKTRYVVMIKKNHQTLYVLYMKCRFILTRGVAYLYAQSTKSNIDILYTEVDIFGQPNTHTFVLEL